MPFTHFAICSHVGRVKNGRPAMASRGVSVSLASARLNCLTRIYPMRKTAQCLPAVLTIAVIVAGSFTFSTAASADVTPEPTPTPTATTEKPATDEIGSRGGVQLDEAGTSGVELSATLRQIDGVAPFQTDNDPGHDSGDKNGIVRTGDQLEYVIEASGNLPSGDSGVIGNFTATMELPKGVYVDQLPGFCVADGSSVSPAPSAIPAPVVPITPTSWESLPVQTVVCNLGNIATGQNLTASIITKVRGEIPNGTVLGPVDVVMSADDSEPATSNTVSATVSARAQYDISKNGAVSTTPNTGNAMTGTGQCNFDSTRTCYTVLYSLTIGAPQSAIGNSPLDGPIVIHDDISAAALYPNLTADQIAQINADPDKYGARIACQNPNTQDVPNYRMGDPNNSVRNSGDISGCDATVVNSTATISITGADLSGLTCPQTAGGGTALDPTRCWMISKAVLVSIPLDTVTDFGVPDGNGASWKLTVRNTYSQIDGVDLGGLTNDQAANPSWNDYRQLVLTAQIGQGFDKLFIGVPGNPLNTNPYTYTVNGPFAGPPGLTSPKGGYGAASPGSITMSGISMTYNAGGLTTDSRTYVGCDYWDNSKLQLAPGDYGSSAYRGFLQQNPSNGAGAWWSGSRIGNNNYSKSYAEAQGVTVKIEYGTGSTNAAGANCAGGVWADSPEDLPGGIAAVNQVRATVVIPAVGNVNNMVGVSIALKVIQNDPGTILPNWSAFKGAIGAVDTATVLADRSTWTTSNYNPLTNGGNLGDRLTVSNATVRLTKQVKNSTGDWSITDVPQFSTGNTVEYRLTPALLTYTDGRLFPVTVEDCLPAGLQFVSADYTPEIQTLAGAPADAGIPCPAGQTYVRWPAKEITSPSIWAITYQAKVLATAPVGIITNTAFVSSPEDVVSTVKDRTQSVNIRINPLGGTYLEKRPVEAVIQPNRAGQTNNQLAQWDIALSFINGGVEVSNPVVIDSFPRNGVNGTSFNGSLKFVSAETIRGSGMTIQYTGDATVDTNPTTNTNTWVNDPSNLSAVTGIRISRAGAFTSADGLTVRVSMVGSGNATDDLYANSAGAVVDGIALPIGPVTSSVAVQGASVGDLVWLDENGDGIQNDDEPGQPGVNVAIDGTDDLGNTVHAETTSDANGRYSVPNLRAGDYVTTFAAPNGLEFTAPATGTGTNDSRPPIGIGEQAGTQFSLAKAENVTDQDAGLVRPNIALTKTASQPANGLFFVTGEEVTYTFVVTNTGSSPLHDVELAEDTFVNGSGATLTLTTPITADADFDGTLAVGAKATFTATYTVTEADVAAGGKIDNTADVAGLSRADQDVAASSAAYVVPGAVPVNVAPMSSLAITGGMIPIALLVIAMLMLLAGAAIVLYLRRKRA